MWGGSDVTRARQVTVTTLPARGKGKGKGAKCEGSTSEDLLLCLLPGLYVLHSRHLMSYLYNEFWGRLGDKYYTFQFNVAVRYHTYALPV